LQITTVRSLVGPPLAKVTELLGPYNGRRALAQHLQFWLHPLQRSMAFVLSEAHERELAEILSRYPNKMAACIPALHLCQNANDNWVSPEVIQFVAERLELPAAHVKGVVTFYTLFNQHKPGKHQVWVCRTLSCALRGSEELLAHCEKRLGIHVGETTADGKFTLRTAECLASCGTAPMMQVDKTYYENLTPEKLDEILAGLSRQ
jgi:NADH-quinone oxidoreductase subunit E